MNKFLKILLVIGITFTVIGGVVFVAAASAAGWDFSAASATQSVEKSHTATTAVTDIKIDYENASVEIRPAPSGSELTVLYPQLQNKKGENVAEITVKEEAGALTVTEKINWAHGFSLWNFQQPKLVLSLPTDRSYALQITTNNGAIVFTEGAFQLTSLHLDTDNGTIQTERATLSVSGAVELSTDNGAIRLGKTTAASLYAETDNGEIRFDENVTADSVRAETNAGAIVANGCLQANDITLDSDVGSITALVYGTRADYTLTVSTDVGNSNLTSSTGGAKTLTVTTDVGSINVRFSGE